MIIPKRPLLVVMALAGFAQGQTSFNTTAGGDQIYDSYGLQTEYKWHQLSGWGGLGYSDGIKVGGYLQVPIIRGDIAVDRHIGIGDQRISAILDTDEYDSHGFSVRGVGLAEISKTSSLGIFSGLLSEERILPYMHTGYTGGGALQQTPLGAAVYQRRFSKTIQVHSLNLMSGSLTSIESIGWTPSKAWRFAGATGMGSGAKYLAGSGELHRSHLDLRTSYTVAGRNFQRQEQPYYSTELVGLNARMTVAPTSTLRFTFEHGHSRTNVVGFPSVLGTIDSGTIVANVLGFQISPSLSQTSSDNLPGHTVTEMVSGSRRILPRWRTFGAYIHTKSPSFEQLTIIATNEFRVSSRLAVRQNYNRMDGQNNFSFGAQWVSNLLSFSVDQQVYYSPIAASFGGRTVFQAWTFSARIRAPHGTNANINSVITPDGRTQFGGYLTGLRYDSIAPRRSTTPLFSKYIIRGKVIDEAGNGVWGIAVQIGSDIVLSDTAGEFYIDVKNTKPISIAVARDSSIQTSYWNLEASPSFTQGRLEADSGEPVQITINTSRQKAGL